MYLEACGVTQSLSEMDKKSLFRENAIKGRANRLDGEVNVAQPLSTTVLTLCLLAFVAAIIYFLTTSSFNRKETVLGFLQPVEGVSKIFAPRGGLITEVFVKDGDTVEEGQPLMLLKIPEYIVGGGDLSSLISSNLDEQLKLLHNRLKQVESQLESQTKELTNLIASKKSQTNDIDVQIGLLTERLNISSERLKSMESLNGEGLISNDEVRTQKEFVLRLRQEASEIRFARESHLAQLEKHIVELGRLPTEKERQLGIIHSEISRLEQEKLELTARSQVLITAPVKGIVTNLLAEVGQYFQPMSSLITILPHSSDLQAVLMVPTRAYGFIKQGQEVKIRFDAFPHQRFGLFKGHISNKSKTVVLPNEVEMPVTLREPAYRVEVVLSSQVVHAYGETMPLQAGMLLSADVVLEERSLLDWLLEPLYTLRGRL